MNALFLSTWFPYPPDNGSKLRVYHLLRALGQQHRVTLVSLAFGTAQPGGVEARSLGCQAVHAVHRNPSERGRLAAELAQAGWETVRWRFSVQGTVDRTEACLRSIVDARVPS